MIAFDIEIRLRRSALLIGGHTAPTLGGDKATARDDDGRPFIPASALRGALRIELERLLRGVHASEDDASISDELRHEAARAAACPGVHRDGDDDTHVGVGSSFECSCLVCAVFGEPGGARGTLRLDDARHRATEPDFGSATLLRPQVAIDRSTRTAADGQLTTMETSEIIETKDGRLLARGRLVSRGPDDDLERHRRALRAAATSLEGIGGGRSRGLGQVVCRLLAMPEAAPSEASREIAATTTPGTTAVRLTLEAKAPLHFGDVPIGIYKPTRDHAPGSTVRGAIAFALLEAGTDPQSDFFRALFTSGDASFGTARIGPSRPSRTRRACLQTDVRTGHHFDDLVGEVVRRVAARHGVALSTDARGACPTCRDRQGKSKKSGAKVRFADDTVAGLVVRSHTRTALNRKTGVAMHRKLFATESLEPRRRETTMNGVVVRPVVMRAEVRGLPRGVADELRSRLLGREVWLGGRKSRGYGRCTITGVDAVEPTTVVAAHDRVVALDRALRSAWSAVAATTENLVDPLGEDHVVAVELSEPWRPADVDAARRGPLPEATELVTAFLATEPAGRFVANEAKCYGAEGGGERPSTAVVAPGSVWVYRVTRAALEEHLAAWIERGRDGTVAEGEERAFGHGRFHFRGATPDEEIPEDEPMMRATRPEPTFVDLHKGRLVEKAERLGQLAAQRHDWNHQIRRVMDLARVEAEPLVVINFVRYQASHQQSRGAWTAVAKPLVDTMNDCLERAKSASNASGEKLGEEDVAARAMDLIRHLLLYTMRAYTWHHRESQPVPGHGGRDSRPKANTDRKANSRTGTKARRRPDERSTTEGDAESSDANTRKSGKRRPRKRNPKKSKTESGEVAATKSAPADTTTAPSESKPAPKPDPQSEAKSDTPSAAPTEPKTESKPVSPPPAAPPAPATGSDAAPTTPPTESRDD